MSGDPIEDRVGEFFARPGADGAAPDVEGFVSTLLETEREPCRRAIESALSLRRNLVEIGLGATPAAAPPALKGFLVESRLGRGGLGSVWAAWDEALRRRVAIKVLRDVAAAPAVVLDEARKAAALRHPNIVTVHSIAEGPEGAAIVMELVDGVPLDKAAANIPFKEKARLLEKVARALAAAHEKGLVHRDLKPENVLVGADLEPKILDFGLAVWERDRSVPSGRFEGTPLFASPEQAALSPEIGPASDVFSFGAVLFLVLTGRVPFDGGTPTEILAKIRSEDPPFPRTLAPNVPEDLQAVALACLARDPAARPTARDVADDLARTVAGEPARLRPALYTDILRRRAAEHLRDVRDWERQGMVAPAEADRLALIYRRVLSDEDHWIFDARRLSFPQIALYTGTWLVVVAAMLLVWFARDRLPPELRAGIPVASAASLLALGAIAWRRREVVGTASFFAGLVLAAIPAAISAFAESGVLGARPDGTGQILPAPYSNEQVLAAVSIALALSIAALASLRLTAFAWTTAALSAAAYVAFLAVRGFLDLRAEEQALRLLPLVALEAAALLFERAGRVRFALPFHAIALATLVLAPDVMAKRGWWIREIGLSGEIDRDRLAAYAFAANGLLLLLVMAAIERAKSLDLRRGARLLEFLVPVHVVGALYANAAETGLWIDVAAHLAAVVLLLALGPWRHRHRFLLGGLAGLALGSHVLLDRELVSPVAFCAGLGAAGLAIATATFALLTRRRQ